MKQKDGNTLLYLSVFDWPKDGRLVVPTNAEVVSAKLLAGGKSLTAKNGTDGVEIMVPQSAPDEMASVIKLELKGQVSPTGNR